MKNKRLFLSPPHMGVNEQGFVRQAFESNYIAPLGPMVDAFEQEFSAYTGIPYCVALSSGTAATHLALRHLMGVGGEGSRGAGQGSARPVVLASTLTFIGSVTPATFEGCELRFIDCDPESWNMDAGLLEQELELCRREGRKVSAVIPTDLYGQSCNLPVIRAICDRHAVPILCDSAEAMGAKYKTTASSHPERSEAESRDLGRKMAQTRSLDFVRKADYARDDTFNGVGAGDESTWNHAGFDAWASVYSFNGNKIMTTSGGGMLASHDKELIDHARKLSQQARDPAPWYEHTEIGFNYRMSNILAAIGRGQLQVLDERVRRRREICEAYRDRLEKVPGISFMPEPSWSRGNRWLTVILIDPAGFGIDTHAVREALERENIEARPVWKPMHLQPVFKSSSVRGGAVSERLFSQGLCLPSGSAMTDDDIDRVVKGILAARP